SSSAWRSPCRARSCSASATRPWPTPSARAGWTATGGAHSARCRAAPTSAGSSSVTAPGCNAHTNQHIAARVSSRDRVTPQLLTAHHEGNRSALSRQVAPPDLAVGPTDRDRDLVALVPVGDGDRVFAPAPATRVRDQ